MKENEKILQIETEKIILTPLIMLSTIILVVGLTIKNSLIVFVFFFLIFFLMIRVGLKDIEIAKLEQNYNNDINKNIF